MKTTVRAPRTFHFQWCLGVTDPSNGRGPEEVIHIDSSQPPASDAEAMPDHIAPPCLRCKLLSNTEHFAMPQSLNTTSNQESSPPHGPGRSSNSKPRYAVLSLRNGFGVPTIMLYTQTSSKTSFFSFFFLSGGPAIVVFFVGTYTWNALLADVVHTTVCSGLPHALPWCAFLAAHDCSALGASPPPRHCTLTQVEAASKAAGPRDILINNVATQPEAPCHEHSLEDWMRALNVNLTSYFLFSKFCLPHMLKAGCRRAFPWGQVRTHVLLPLPKT